MIYMHRHQGVVMPCPKCGAAAAAGAVLVFGAADEHQTADADVDGAGAAPGWSTQPG